MSEPPLVVAIDGPSGVGKSTTARALADRLGLPYLDTGAMYRSVALEVLRRDIDPNDATATAEVAEGVDLQLQVTSSGESQLLLRGRPLGDAIRSSEVSRVTSQISTQRGVRARMVELQRRFGRRYGGGVEGRDIGTMVFPDAPVKFFLDAAPEERARRRHRQLHGPCEDDHGVAEIARQLADRDRQDRERSDSPLRCDSSYVRIDSSLLDPEEVLSRMIEHVESRRAN